jgi:hypothetical protein
MANIYGQQYAHSMATTKTNQRPLDGQFRSTWVTGSVTHLSEQLSHPR